MADDDGGYRLIFLREAFTSLVGNIPIALLRSQLAALPLVVPITDARMMLLGEGVIVEWIGEPPTVQDRTDVRAKVAAFVGGSTTSEPFVVVSNAASTTTTSAAVAKLDFTSPALDGGTYHLDWSSQIRMTAVVAGEAVRAIMTLTVGAASPVTQQTHWGEAVQFAYNGGATFKVQSGDVVKFKLEFAEVGPGAGTAEMSGARVTVDKIS
jgi:hypothetical protein